jgi:hypothetical protein
MFFTRGSNAQNIKQNNKMPKTCFAPAAVFGSKQIEDKSAFVLGKVTSFGCQVVLWHQKKL